jgi:hypothetical protein
MSAPDVPYSGAGATFGIKVPPAAVYTVLAQVIELEPPKVSIDKIDTTVLSSKVMTSIPSIVDNGETTFSIMYIPTDAGVAMLLPLTTAPLVVGWQITLPDGTSPATGTTLAFSGFISSWEPKGFAIGDKAVADVTITVTGAVTTTPAT